MTEDYPKWIDEWAKSFHKAFVGMAPWSWGPVDVFTIVSNLNGTFISRIKEAIERIKEKGCSMEEIVNCFPSISSLRAALYYLAVEHQGSKNKDRKEFKEVMEFLVEILKEGTEKDIFAYDSNIVRSKEEINNILDTIEFEEGNPQVARELGKLYTSLASMGFALFKDFFPQETHEIEGPYDVSERYGEKAILIIKSFPKIRPVDLWPQTEELNYSNVKIFQVFKNIEFKCEFIGMHSIYKGDLINNLEKYSVLTDNNYLNNVEEIKKLSDYFAEYATNYSSFYDDLKKEELIAKSLEWECYQFNKFFDLAGMDWRPTKEMFEALKGVDIPLRSERASFPDFEEYVADPENEVYWLKDLYKKTEQTN